MKARRVATRGVGLILALVASFEASSEPRFHVLENEYEAVGYSYVGSRLADFSTRGHVVGHHNFVEVSEDCGGFRQERCSYRSIAFRWHEDEGFAYVDEDRAGRLSTAAVDISADGEWITGGSSLPGFPDRIYVWNVTAGFSLLPEMPLGFFTGVSAISADGSTIVGSTSLQSGQGNRSLAYRWRVGSELELFRNLSANEGMSHATDVSADGTRFVGSYLRARVPTDPPGPAPAQEAYLYSDEEGLARLGIRGRQPNLRATSNASAMTPDARVVVGLTTEVVGNAWYRWTRETGMQRIAIRGGSSFSIDADVSDSGLVVVAGQGIWMPGRESLLARELFDELGFDLAGIELRSDLSLSRDGRSLTGTAEIDSLQLGWVALDVLPITIEVEVRPGQAAKHVSPEGRGILPVALLGSTFFDVRTVEPTSIVLGARYVPSISGDAVEYADVNGDGFEDLIAEFPVRDLGVEEGDSHLCLSAVDSFGEAIGGCAEIVAVPLICFDEPKRNESKSP